MRAGAAQLRVELVGDLDVGVDAVGLAVDIVDQGSLGRQQEVLRRAVGLAVDHLVR